MFFESFLLNLTVIIVLIVALTFDYVTKFFSYWYVRHIPYKTPIPFFGSDYHRVLGIRNNTDEVNKLYEKYPNEKFVGCIKSRIPDLIVREPDAIKRMLSTDFANFHSRGLGLDKSQDVCLRNNLFYADGEKWTLLREGIELLIKDMDCSTEDLHECLSGTNGDVNVQQLLSKVLDSVYKGMLLDKDSDVTVITNLRSLAQKRSIGDRLKSYLKVIFPSLYELFGLTTLPGEPSTKTNYVIQKSKLLEKIKNGSIFQLGLKEKSGKNTSDNFAFATLSSFITEGYVPCHTALTALFYNLAKHPELQDLARTNEEYLDAAVKESLRLHPPFSVISRECVKMYSYPENKLVIDKKITVDIPVEAIHMDEKYYNKPSTFIPERFFNNNNANSHSYAYLTFGAGPRKCVGEDDLPEELLLALGNEGEEKLEQAEEIRQELASRWSRIMSTGLGKEARNSLINKYPVPKNFTNATAPLMNPEIGASLSEISLKRDRRIVYRQNVLGTTMSSLGKALTSLLKGNFSTTSLIEQINDAAKLIAEVFHQDSSSRRFFALAGANSIVKEAVRDSKSDKFLFGNDCAENIKAAQAIKRTGSQIKNPEPAALPKSLSKVPKKQGNFRGPPLQQQQHRHQARGGHRQLPQRRYNVNQPPQRDQKRYQQRSHPTYRR